MARLLPVAVASPPHYLAAPSDSHLRMHTVVGPGAVLIVCVDPPVTDYAPLHATVAHVRSHHPSVPMFIGVRADAISHAVSLAFATTRLQVRGILAYDRALEAPIRETLSAPVDLIGDLVFTLQERGVLDAIVAPSIRRLLADCERPSSLSRAERRRIRATLQRRALPSPRAWCTLARVLRLSLRLQREPALSVERLALLSAQSDGATMSRMFRVCTGLSPSECRSVAGWEWLVERWLLRHGCHARMSGRAAVR